MNFIRKIVKSRSIEDQELRSELRKLLNFSPRRINKYKKAFTHRSVQMLDKNGIPINYERLEFLGDSILDSVVAEVLFAKFPQGKEGFLTQIRSRIVSRSSLNKLGFALGLDKLIEAQMSRDVKETSLSGNALEALIGAIYIDKGFKFTNQFIRKKLIEPHIHFDTILTHESDPKSRVIEKAQKQKVKVNFQTALYQKEEPQSFQSKVVFDGEEISKALGSSKKKAEQRAAAEALKEHGATKVVALATHPVLSGNAISNLNDSVLDELVVTDTIPLSEAARACERIRQLSVADLLGETIRRIHEDESVSSVYMD